jgi:hypothetical protein
MRERRSFAVFSPRAPSVVVEFGTILSKVGARLEENFYVGPMCHLGLVHLEGDVLVAAGVHIPSGPMTQGVGDLDTPIREQPGVCGLAPARGLAARPSCLPMLDRTP